MSDITKCSPTKLKPKCNSCFRMTAPTDEYRQSYSNFYDECDKYYWPITIKPKFRLVISHPDYMKKMDKIIAKGGAVHETLIALLDEANKYTIITKKKGGKVILRKCDNCNKILTKESDYFALGDIDFHKGKSDMVRLTMTDDKGSKNYDMSESWSDWTDIHFCPECFKKETISRFTGVK